MLENSGILNTEGSLLGGESGFGGSIRREEPVEPRSLPPLTLVDDHERRDRWIRGILALAIIALLGFGAYRYGRPLIERNWQLLGQVPHLQQSLTAADHRLGDAESRLQDLTAGQAGFSSRVAKLEESATAGFQTIRRQTGELVSQAEQRMRAEMDQRAQVFGGRLDKVQTAQETDTQRVAQLQTELASAREQIAAQSQQISALQQETSGTIEKLGQQFARLDTQSQQDRRSLSSVSAQVERKRIDFTAPRGQSRQIAPGISLQVTRTDANNARIDGWLWLAADGRKIWMRQQSSQTPLVFYTKDDNRPRELVITNVNRNSVAGYLVTPSMPAADPSSSADSQLSSETPAAPASGPPASRPGWAQWPSKP
jgi:predicted  nucleic acid-binding Zn-ribbon protein